MSPQNPSNVKTIARQLSPSFDGLRVSSFTCLFEWSRRGLNLASALQRYFMFVLN